MMYGLHDVYCVMAVINQHMAKQEDRTTNFL
jgi:hypothetical protein